jgi:hypothetical protein
MNGDK